MNNDTDNPEKRTFTISLKTDFAIAKIRNAENIKSISQLIDIEQLSVIMEPFWQSTGLGVALFDENFDVLTSVGWQKICTHFHQKHPEAHKSCIESQNYFRKNFKPDEILSYKCKNGLWDLAYPIFQQETFLGYVSFGQFFINDEEIEKAFFVQQAQKYNFDTEAYISHLRTIPIFSSVKLESHITLFLTMLKLNADRKM